MHTVHIIMMGGVGGERERVGERERKGEADMQNKANFKMYMYIVDTKRKRERETNLPT